MFQNQTQQISYGGSKFLNAINLLLVPQNDDIFVSEIEKSIKIKAFQKQIRVKEFFKDFDKLKRGVITGDKFKSAIAMGGFQLTSKEFDALMKKYSVGNNEYNWIQFQKNIDQVFEDIEWTRTNLINPPSSQVKKNIQKFWKDGDIQFILAAYAQAVSVNGLLLRYPFQAHDKINSSRFQRVLDQLKIMPNPLVLDKLFQHYQYENSKEVNYVRFCNDIENLIKPQQQQMNSTNMKSQTIKAEPIIPQASVSIEEVLLKIRSHLNASQFTIEIFRDYDPLRKGTVGKDKVQQALKFLKIQLDQNEWDEIVKQFACDYGTKLNYTAFLKQIHSPSRNFVFYLNQVNEANTSEFPELLDPQNTLKPNEQQDLNFLMIKLGEEISKKRIQLKTFLQDQVIINFSLNYKQDKSKTGKISYQRFRAILDNQKLPLNQNEFYLLCQRFNHEGIELNFLEFDKLLSHYIQE